MFLVQENRNETTEILSNGAKCFAALFTLWTPAVILISLLLDRASIRGETNIACTAADNKNFSKGITLFF